MVGCGRSGTTLLQILVDAHPQIAIPPGSRIFFNFAGLFGLYGDPRRPANLRLLVKDVLEDIDIKEWGLEISVSEFCQRLRVPSIRNVMALPFELYAQQQGKRRWGDKSPIHTLYAEDIRRIFPDAQFIHLVRDGRDVAVSLRETWFGPLSIVGSAEHWKRHVLAVHKLKASLRPDQFLEVRYESLVRHPQRELERIFTFLAEEPYVFGSPAVPDTERKRYYLNKGRLFRSLGEPITEDKVGVYQRVLRRRQIEMFESVAGDVLDTYRYRRQMSETTGVTLSERIGCLVADKCVLPVRKLTTPAFVRREVQRRLRKCLRAVRAWRVR